MSPTDKGEKNVQSWKDSIEIKLSSADREFLDAVDKAYSHRTFKHLSLDNAAEHLLGRLKAAARDSEEIEVFGLDRAEQDAAGILAQSGEAIVYRDKRNRLCIKYKGNGLLEGLLLHG
ncbi:MAG: hypothetical protein HY941_01885 [Gammaproteobacteria bacterium]|nr:hypothetical protein [Gammaproteobacteria bacterium]